MPRSLYLINPLERAPGYHSMEVLEAWRIVRAINLADLSTTTVAALAPRDWHVSICDERVQAVDFATAAEIVGLTGKVSQRDRMIELAGEFRKRGKIVVIGGPYASLNPDDMRPHADILVRGELEAIAGRLFADLAAGRWEPDYAGTRPDLALSPVPRWDLYPRRIALAGQVQTSRGCPFECEFCDVIQYLGRQQRWKEPDQVARELDALYALGFRDVFFADDNFTIMRRRTRALLERVSAWNAARPARVRFSTQASIDLARDDDLMQGCVEAGLNQIFVGIETPNEDSLAETHKRQNLRVDLAGEVRKMTAAGILVSCGIVVGFDNDGPGIFERQAAFIESLPAPMIVFSVLNAPAATPLHARLAKEGRLVGRDDVGAGAFLTTNIRPKRMSAEALREGAAWLLKRIYAPEAFARRLSMYVDLAPVARGPAPQTAPIFGMLEMALARRLAQYGIGEQRLVALIGELKIKRPDLRAQLSYALLFYCQVRFMLDFHRVWGPPGTVRAAI